MKIQELQQHYQSLIQNFEKDFFQFPWENEKFYSAWLSQSFYFVSHSTRLLALAAGYADIDEEEMHKRFIAHISEELNHEVLAKRDLKHLQSSPESFGEFQETTKFYEDQKQILATHGPSAFMGWILFLEGIASTFGPKLMGKTKVFGEKANSFLKLHAEEDEGHIESAFQAIASIPEHKLDLLCENMKKSASTYREILHRAQEVSMSSSSRQSA